MTRFMYDSVDVAAMPDGAFAYAGYVNGGYVTFAEVVERFYPRAHCFSITVTASGIAACLDVEHGDATPAQCAGWVRMMLAHGQDRPCIYANLSTMPAVKANLAGVSRASYRLWVADWTAVQHIPAGYDACQYLSAANYDESMLADNFFSRPLHEAPAAPVPHGTVHGLVGYTIGGKTKRERWHAVKSGSVKAPDVVLNPKGRWRTVRVQVNDKTGDVRIKPSVFS